MRPAKSINSLPSQQYQMPASTTNTNGRAPTGGANGQPTTTTTNNNNSNNNNNNASPTSPICRCRVMYLGSAVPHITKDGLQGIQGPLRELYPDKGALDTGNAGIDSWLSVWSNGILIENVDENGREVKRFFKIDALHYCAAVKFVGGSSQLIQQQQQQQLGPYTSLPNGANLANLPKFLPLDSPHARLFTNSPPVFASILRRTTGIKVLECHAFICKREAAANALVRCCFHAYADTMYAKQIEGDITSTSVASKTPVDLNNNENESHYANKNELVAGGKDGGGGGAPIPPMTARRSKSIAALNEANGGSNSLARVQQANNISHAQTMMRRKSVNEHYANDCDMADNGRHNELNSSSNLMKQHKLSKSLHHLNQNNGGHYTMNFGHPYHHHPHHHQTLDCDGYPMNQSTSASCINVPQPPPLPPLPSNGRWQQQDPRYMHQQQVPPPPQQQPFYNPYSARVPSYPPQNMLETSQQSGTLRSIKSMAANSIASTLLRSKKHAKAMSMAQLNQEKIISFHQHHGQNGTTIGGPLMMPPVPPMFLPNLPPRTIVNGSQTMKPTSRSMVMGPPPHMNFETMTPKEMKKLLKKSAKYGIDPNKFGENGLPLLPMRHPPPPIPMHLQPPPPPPPLPNHLTQHSNSGTMMSQGIYSDMYGSDMMAPVEMMPHHHHQHSGLPPPPPRGMHPPPPMLGDPMDPQQQMKPILVKPNPEFLKSKAGKKWLKQQKEFKKLLPPHLDGLPIVFGPPPVSALEPAGPPPPPSHHNGGFIAPPAFIPPPPPPPPSHHPSSGLPMMDSSGYYNPHPFYGQTGRASAASTLMRYSPNSQATNGIMHDGGADYMHKNHVVYSNGMMNPMQKDYLGDESSMMYSGINDGTIDGHSVRLMADQSFRLQQQQQQQQQRNHMIEQSVISLGDENDYDDDDDDDGEDNDNDNEQEEDDGGQDHYNVAQRNPEAIARSKRSSVSRSRNGSEQQSQNSSNYHHEKPSFAQQGFEQQQQAHNNQSNDDQSSYSSGIYKRGHINERAFSYSIRQEHKSSGGGGQVNVGAANGTGCRNDDNPHLDQECHMNQDNHHHRQAMFQHERDQNDEYYQSNNELQSMPVNELTSRLESQLNMKSFANSRIKSHM